MAIVTETQRQLARLRAALDKLGDKTEGTRTPDADHAFYECFGPLEVLEREANMKLPSAEQYQSDILDRRERGTHPGQQ